MTLTAYGVDARCPGFEPDADEAAEAVRLAGAVLAWAEHNAPDRQAQHDLARRRRPAPPLVKAGARCRSSATLSCLASSRPGRQRRASPIALLGIAA